MLALMLGAIDLLLLPYGTALGCYALWVLLHEEGKKMFAAPISRVVPVPIGVNGLQRAIRSSAFHPPRTTPSLAITASA